MNYTKASCGHLVIAVGAPGSIARKRAEQSPCDECLAATDIVDCPECGATASACQCGWTMDEILAREG